MRNVLAFGIVVVFAACGGGDHGTSQCQTVVPAPPACMTTCDPQPGAPNTCPTGYHCTPDGLCDAVCTAAGGECGTGYHCTSDGQCVGDGACTGLQCQQVDCAAQGKPTTTISGTVFAPNGTLPLYGADVYVPNAAVPPFTAGAQCSRCSTDLPGSPIVQTSSDEAGKFSLQNVPSGDNIPVVIAIGKWRRQVVIPHINECADNPITSANTSLPKKSSEGDIPQIAITTGNADSLECLIRKLGVDDSEISTSAGAGKVHLYAGNGVNKFKAGFPGGSGQTFTSATPFWSSVATLTPYDIVILSCEGAQNPNTKPQAAMDAMKAYADLGGRVFASHWHNIWIGGAFQAGGNGQKPAVWTSIATWANGNDPGPVDLIDEVGNPKGASFATWMLNVMGSTVRDQIQLQSGTDRSTCTMINNTKAERWTYAQSNMHPQNFQFTTPNEAAVDMRCGKVVFSDMHVSGGPGGGDYPDSCGTGLTLTPQEKALAFMFFDIASCVNPGLQ
ncbi:MAG: hypothetical protein JWO36_5595 [Myxococcales bacterium]|nr:hypothetical protein [Myxococcales bacterium]